MALSVYLWYMLVRTFKVTLDFQVGYIGMYFKMLKISYTIFILLFIPL